MKKILAEYEAEKFLAKKLPVAKSVIVKNEKNLGMALKKVRLPCVLKIISTQTLHKTEIGGVVFAHDEKQAIEHYKKLILLAKKKKIKIEGILVQEMLTGKEVIIGIKNDQAFGHVIAFGIGGKYVEILKDITFRACPIDRKDAEEMINELKFGKILFGARNEKPVNRNVLVNTLLKVSMLAVKNKRIEELDINPFIVNEKSGKVVDARIVFN
jgi:acyl-CoA synthetase (NDP forming)